MMWLGLVMALIPALVAVVQEDKGPHLKLSLTRPVTKLEGEDALLTCVVTNQGDFTLMWKKTSKVPQSKPSILTANTATVTSDKRVKAMHQLGGRVYVLKIANVTMFDAGMYFCEVNKNPPIRSFHELKVRKKYRKMKSNPISSSSLTTTTPNFLSAKPMNHNFTSCCMSKGVSTSCQRFCDLKTFMDSTTNVDAESCRLEFLTIASCTADGRNHMPCCLASGMPEVCADPCRGEFNVQTDNINTMFSCSKYMAHTLGCFVDGIEKIPMPPRGLTVDALNDTAISIAWLPPTSGHHLRDHYRVNVTFLMFLTPESDKTARKAQESYSNTTHLVGKYKSDLVVTGLEKFSVYWVSMWAEKSDGGKSLLTSGVKVVTHVYGQKEKDGFEMAPAVPDVRKCCVDNNVSHDRCVDKFCNPHNVAYTTQEDMMICAPWDTAMFSCLADGQDHTPCCAEKGVPLHCQELCSGNVTNIDFKHFDCLNFMPVLSSCLLEGYGVLPSSPVNFTFSNLHTDFAILHWDKPLVLGDTVLDYVVVAQKWSPTVGTARTLQHVHSPYILDQLDSSSTYEVFVEPANQHGVGQPSSRLMFETPGKTLEKVSAQLSSFNQTDCCVKSQIKQQCLPLCSYNANISDIKHLESDCADDFTKLVRCATGGRDHLSCCERRGVPKSCQPLCQAVHQVSSGADLGVCLPHIGQIFTCYEEGTAQLPPPVRDLKAINVEDGNVFLAWKSDDLLNTKQFEVFYKQVSSLESGADVFDSDKQRVTAVPLVKIDNLEVGKIYRFFVVSHNDKGTSLPSSLVTLNVSSLAWNGSHIQGATSPPHLLELNSRSTTWLQFTWNPPAISHPEDMLKYRMYFLPHLSNMTDFKTLETDVTTIRLTGLKPNTQYATFITAIIVRNQTEIESTNSEELLVWTDPAFPAHVEVRIVRDDYLEGKLTGDKTKIASQKKSLTTIKEGGSMTVLCIATGMPLPTLVLSVNGVAIHSDVTRYMATVVHNITKDTSLLSCYANNGYGDPMQAERMITVSRAPTIFAPMTTSVIVGDVLTLVCRVEAYPAPTLGFYRDKKHEKGMKESDRVKISATADWDDNTKFKISMEINNVSVHDGSLYYCYANNTMGEKTAIMGVTVEQLPNPVINVTECCIKQNVTKDCLDICSFSLDFYTMLRKPQCIPQFQQMMSCAADGSDHRHCCSTGGVPGICLNWCRGEVVEETKFCALEHSRTIIGCFHEGSTNIPGPPTNLVVAPLDQSSAVATWDKPNKNPGSVDIYRVFWRQVGARGTNKSDIVENKIVLHDLEKDTVYEVVVKAGNAQGTSQLTEPLHFSIDGPSILQSPLLQSNASNASEIVFAVFFFITAILVVLYFLYKRNLVVFRVKKADRPTVAFENPFYAIRNPSQPGSRQAQQELSEEYNVHISSSSSWPADASGSSSDCSSDSASPRNDKEMEVKQTGLL